MTNVVLLGGNGYIGRNVLQAWELAQPETNFYLISRSGKGQISGERIHYIKADVATATLADLTAQLPDSIDYVVNFVGFAFAPKDSQKTLSELNWQPAKLAIALAKHYQVKAQGFIGGTLGGKEFVAVKIEIANELRDTGIPTAVVAPTVVYGGGRSDALSKLVPIFKFFGLFSKNLKPVLVEEVTDDMLIQLGIQ